MEIRQKFIDILRWSEKYTETDMVYAVKGSFWIMFGKIVIFSIAFLKMIIFGRYLTQEAYGVYTFILSMAAILGISSLSGINTSLIKAIAQKKDGTLGLAVKERLKFSLLGSFASLIASGWYFYNQNIPLGSAFLIIAIFLPSYSAFEIFSGFWVGKKKFETQSKYEIISAILIASVTIPTIILTNNPALIILALFASQSLFNGILLAKAARSKENEEIMPEAISFGKSLTIMGAISAFAGQIDKVILWKFFGPVQLALYSFAQLPIQKIQGVVPIGILALPKIGEKDVRDIKEGLMKKFQKLFFIFTPLTILVILLGPYFYKIILSQYIDSIPYFQAFALLLIFSPFQLLSSSLVSEMKKKDLYIIQTLTPILKILLFIALIPFFGIWGVVSAIIISHAASSILSLYFFKKI